MSSRDLTPRTERGQGRGRGGGGWEAGERSSLSRLGWVIAKIDKLLPSGFHHQEGRTTRPPSADFPTQRERMAGERWEPRGAGGSQSGRQNTRMEIRTCFPTLSLENMQEEV